ncbi:radical SAM protein [bacterium]|nr:radical SAM protein [candidate division CSSED10-310 bacterium]
MKDTEERLDAIAGTSASDVSGWLDVAFQSILGRLPDPEARAHYSHTLISGKQTRRQVLNEMAASTEYRNIEKRRVELLGPYLLKNDLETDGYECIRKLQLEVTTHCNVDPPCAMCVRTWTKGPPRNMRPEHLSSFRDWLSEDADITLFGQGEPFMNPRFWEFVDELHRPGRRIGFSTNGLLMNEAHCRTLVLKKIDWLNISMDACTHKTYARIRGQDFDKLRGNIRRLTGMRTELPPEICVNMTIMQSNVHEVTGFCHQAADLKVDKVLFSPLCPVNSPKKTTPAPDGGTFEYELEAIYQSTNRSVRTQLALAEQLCLELGIAFHYSGDYPHFSSEQVGPAPATGARIDCRAPWSSAWIGLDGSVCFCNYQRGLGPALILGNIEVGSLGDIMNGSLAASIRNQILNEPLPDVCQGCPIYEAARCRLVADPACSAGS